jgi:hypothetical protein
VLVLEGSCWSTRLAGCSFGYWVLAGHLFVDLVSKLGLNWGVYRALLKWYTPSLKTLARYDVSIPIICTVIRPMHSYSGVLFYWLFLAWVIVPYFLVTHIDSGSIIRPARSPVVTRALF